MSRDKGAVTDTMAALDLLAGFGLRVYPERCVRVRNRHASCNRCAASCTSGAIALEDATWRITPSLCVGCGTCATVCPTCALEAQHPNDADLRGRAMDTARHFGGTAIFACSRAIEDAFEIADTTSVVELICLSRLEESIIAELFANDVREIVLVHGACGSCSRQSGIQSAFLVVATMQTLVAAWGIDREIKVVDEFPACACTSPVDPVVDQRLQEGHRFTRYMNPSNPPVDSAAQVVAEGAMLEQAADSIVARYTPPHVREDGTLPHFVPVRRGRLLDQLARLGRPVVDHVDTRLWGHVVIDFDRCCSCKMCAVFCPTGAISTYVDEKGAAGIEHYLAECVHCCLCQDICPEHAIECETRVGALRLISGEPERYEMPEPVWHTGPDQILRRMRPQISGNEVCHSY